MRAAKEAERIAQQEAREIARIHAEKVRMAERAAAERVRAESAAARESVRAEAQAARARERELARLNAAADSLQRQRSAAIVRAFQEEERAARRSADAQIREAQRRHDNVLRLMRSEQSASSQVGGAASDIAGALPGGLGLLARGGPTAAVATGFIAAATAGLTYRETLEKLNRSFVTLTGSQERAQAHLKELQRFAAATPFEFEDVARASQKFQAMGIQAKDVVPVLTAVGNAVARTGGGSAEVERVARAISQVIARGKVSAEEMNQLADALVDGWGPLQQELGKTRGELQKMAEQGQISADTFVRAFLKAHQGGKAMSDQMNTLTGALSTLKDRGKEALADFFDPLYQQLRLIAVGMANTTREADKQVGTIDKLRAAYGLWLAQTSGSAGDNRRLRGLPSDSSRAAGGGVASLISEGDAAGERARLARQMADLNRQLLEAIRVGGPASDIIRKLESDLRTLGDDSAVGKVTERFRQLRQEWENTTDAPQNWRTMLAGAEREALAAARAYDEAAKALKARQDAEREAARTREQALSALQSATAQLENFGKSEADAAENTLLWTTGLRHLNDTVKGLSIDNLVRLTREQVAQKSLLETLNGLRSDYIQSLGGEEGAVARVNRVVADYLKQGRTLTDQMITLATHAKEVAKVADTLRALSDVTTPSGATLPELTPSTATGPTFDDSHLGLPPPNVFADRARRYRELQEIAHDLADITSDVFDSIGTGWDNMWRRMLDTARRTLSDIVNEMLRVSFERLLTGNSARSEAGGLVGAVVNGIFGGGRSSSGASAGGIGSFAANIPAFAGGGQFTVGGWGGTDSQFVPFWATPGERVTVTPPGQGGMPNINLNVAISPRQIRELQEVESSGVGAKLSRTIRAKRDRRRNVLRFA